jgi:hypothetical protein
MQLGKSFRLSHLSTFSEDPPGAEIWPFSGPLSSKLLARFWSLRLTQNSLNCKLDTRRPLQSLTRLFRKSWTLLQADLLQVFVARRPFQSTIAIKLLAVSKSANSLITLLSVSPTVCSFLILCGRPFLSCRFKMPPVPRRTVLARQLNQSRTVSNAATPPAAPAPSADDYTPGDERGGRRTYSEVLRNIAMDRYFAMVSDRTTTTQPQLGLGNTSTPAAPNPPSPSAIIDLVSPPTSPVIARTTGQDVPARVTLDLDVDGVDGSDESNLGGGNRVGDVSAKEAGPAGRDGQGGEGGPASMGGNTAAEGSSRTQSAEERCEDVTSASDDSDDDEPDEEMRAVREVETIRRHVRRLRKGEMVMSPGLFHD